MGAVTSVSQFRRAVVEAWIEHLIALLDEIDGDENLEPYLADTYPQASDCEYDDSEMEDDPTEGGIADAGGLAEQCCGFAGVGWVA